MAPASAGSYELYWVRFQTQESGKLSGGAGYGMHILDLGNKIWFHGMYWL